MKRMLFAVCLAVFLGCTAGLMMVEWMRPGEFVGAEHVVAQLSRRSQEPVTMGMQKNLAKWYNLNLYSDIQDKDFPEKYWDILDFTNHAMGYVSVPALGIRLPIYHGTEEDNLRQGAGHIQDTAIPLGQPGEHTGLVFPISLEEGTYFYIHILQQVLAYQVTETEYTGANDYQFPPEQEESLCTLVYGGKDRVKLIRANLTTTAPEEKDISVETLEDSDGWQTAACLVLAMGILLVPFLMWCRTE